MNMKCSELEINEGHREFINKLNSLDFGPLAYKLMNPEDRPGLSCEQAIDAIKKYKGFLFLYYANKGKAVSPSRYIDYVWHTHIMDTELYTVQSAILFGYYLHHFPFFGKRDEADQNELLAAAEFTKSQAFSYFDWDDDDWCGTGRKPKWPGSSSDLANLVNVIFPAGANISGINQNPDVINIQAGNFKHTIEYFDSPAGNLFSLNLNPSRLDHLARIIRLPIWVIVCFPAEINILNDIMKIAQGETKLVEISNSLVEKRLTPESFYREQVTLKLRN